jgi:hypothetical protein
MTVFIHFQPTTVYTGALPKPSHPGHTLVRRFNADPNTPMGWGQ